jgi:hypothetical protein
MRGKLKLGLFCVMLVTIFGATFRLLPISFAAPVVRCYSDVTQIGDAVTMPDVRGTIFKVAVTVFNVTDFYGFDIEFNWTTSWIHYLNYTVTVPVDTYSSVQPPSPYPGILNSPYMPLKKVVNESDNIPSADAGAMAWIGFSQMLGSDSFDGSGTVCVFTFNVTDQPFDYEAPSGVILKIHFVSTSLSSSLGFPIVHTREDLEIPLYPREFTYPAVPKLKVTPSFITGYDVNQTFDVNVTLLGADNASLSPFWDVAGIEFYLNYNSTYLQALDATIDPDGTFGAFWSSGSFELMKDLQPSYVQIAFMGLGETHTPVNGMIRIAKITFNVTYLPNVYPRPIASMYLENPVYPSTWYILDADSGIIDLSSPVVTEWTSIYPLSTYPYAFNLTDWTDVNGNGKLDMGDQIILLNKDTMKTHDYKVDETKGTLKLNQEYIHSIETYTAADLQADIVDIYGVPPPLLSSGGSRNGTGIPDWTGTVNITYPVQTINSIHVTPQIGSEYDLTPADYTVNPDGSITLNRALDEWVLNELIGTMPVAGAGWPSIAYFASSIQSVWIDMHNGTARYAYNSGYHSDVPSPKHKPMPAGGEWWFDDDYPWELESWWATGYCDANLPINPWPTGTDIYVNYTAVPTITIDYKAPPDTAKYFMQWPGTYESFLTILDPTNTTWTQIYGAYNKVWNITAWVDNDYDARLSNGDELTMVLGGLEAVFTVDSRDTQIRALEYPCVQDIDPLGMYYTNRRYVEVAGFPHPERPQSPWFGRDFGIPLPVEVENAFFTSPFQSLGRDIDLYTDYPDTFNGRNEYNMQIDAYGPQSTIKLIAKVTYAMNPVQSKPVTFSARHGEFDFSFCNFTGSDGIAWVEFGLPWPCDDPEGRTFGIWNCSASVSIREVTVTDTLTFESGWLIEITEITPNPTDSFHIGQHLNFTIKYTSISHQIRSAVFTLVVTDDLDVPIAWWVLTAFDVVYGADQTVTIQCIEVPKWTFVGQGKVWANIYTDLPQNGGVQYGPEARISIGLTI